MLLDHEKEVQILASWEDEIEKDDPFKKEREEYEKRQKEIEIWNLKAPKLGMYRSIKEWEEHHGQSYFEPLKPIKK